MGKRLHDTAQTVTQTIKNDTDRLTRWHQTFQNFVLEKFFMNSRSRDSRVGKRCLEFRICLSMRVYNSPYFFSDQRAVFFCFMASARFHIIDAANTCSLLVQSRFDRFTSPTKPTRNSKHRLPTRESRLRPRDKHHDD